MQSSLFCFAARIMVWGGLSFMGIGCAASYSTPGEPADFKALGMSRDSLTDAGIAKTLAKQPLAKFPCSIAAVRIQSPEYKSESAQTYGHGSYCVITTRNIESEEAWKKLAGLPKLTGIAPFNRLLLPEKLDSDLELRQAAASLHADILLIYTIDTKFDVQDHLAPATVITLGLSPNMSAHVVSTASAVLLDTRNGYIYGYTEATEHGQQFTNGWMTESAVQDVCKRTETQVFTKLADGLKGTWMGIVQTYAEVPTSGKVSG